MAWLSLFHVLLFLPCGGGGRCRGGGGCCCVGGGRHVDDELGEDVRREEVDADADQLISLLAVVVDEAVLDAHLGAPVLGTLQRRRLGSWPPDSKTVYFLPARRSMDHKQNFSQRWMRSGVVNLSKTFVNCQSSSRYQQSLITSGQKGHFPHKNRTCVRGPGIH